MIKPPAAQRSQIATSPLGRLRARLGHFDGLADVRAFLAIGAALTLIPLALSRQGLRRVLIRLEHPAPVRHRAPGSPGDAAARARRLARYADFWLRRLRARNPCLRRSLVLFGRLRRAGLPVTFCLGIRKDQALGSDDAVEGHAWLELDGRAILESAAAADRHFLTFRYPTPGHPVSDLHPSRGSGSPDAPFKEAPFPAPGSDARLANDHGASRISPGNDKPPRP